MLHICDERDHEYKEEIIHLRKQLEEAWKFEEVMNSWLKERELQCEILEVEFFLARNELDENNRI